MGTLKAMDSRKYAAASIGLLFVVVTFAALYHGHSDTTKRQKPAPLIKEFSVFNLFGGTCTTVDSVDIDKFTGSWYQVINNGYTNIFGGGSSCVGTVYTKSSDTAVDVQNGNEANCNTTTGALGTCDDFSSLINGTAAIDDSSQPGQLTRTLYTPFLFGATLPTTGSFWICKLGPVVNGQYEYAIVSDSDGVSLYVLARNVATYYSTYYTEVHDYINTNLSWMTGLLAPVDKSFGTCSACSCKLHLNYSRYCLC